MSKPNLSNALRIDIAAADDWREAQSSLREASQWLIDAGMWLWELDEFTQESLRPRAARGEIVLGHIEERAVAVMFLTWHDPDFWPEVPPDASGYIHKLAVRRAHAGTGVAHAMVRWALDRTRDHGCDSLRVDCDDRPALRRFYTDAGFAFLDIVTVRGYRTVRMVHPIMRT
jgi:GNAT superfamily N-acetyltransferase